MTIIGNCPTIFGIHEPKPLRGFPPGKARISMRDDCLARVWIRTSDGIREFVPKDAGDFLEIDFETGRNQSVENEPSSETGSAEPTPKAGEARAPSLFSAAPGSANLKLEPRSAGTTPGGGERVE
jgi:hypothetical protein